MQQLHFQTITASKELTPVCTNRFAIVQDSVLKTQIPHENCLQALGVQADLRRDTFVVIGSSKRDGSSPKKQRYTEKLRWLLQPAAAIRTDNNKNRFRRTLTTPAMER